MGELSQIGKYTKMPTKGSYWAALYLDPWVGKPWPPGIMSQGIVSTMQCTSVPNQYENKVNKVYTLQIYLINTISSRNCSIETLVILYMVGYGDLWGFHVGKERQTRQRFLDTSTPLSRLCTQVFKVSKSGDKIEGREMFRSWRLGAPPLEGPAGTSHKWAWRGWGDPGRPRSRRSCSGISPLHLQIPEVTLIIYSWKQLRASHVTLTEIFKGVLGNGSHTSILNKLRPTRVEIIFALLEVLGS